MPKCTKCEWEYTEDELMCGELCWDCAEEMLVHQQAELESTFNALLHARDIVELADGLGAGESFTRNDESTIHQKALKLRAFIEARTEA